MNTAAKKARKKPVAKAKKQAPKPSEQQKRTVGEPGDFHISKEPEKKEPPLRPMHAALIAAMKGGKSAFGTVGTDGTPGGWVTVADGDKKIRASFRLLQSLLKEVGRKDRVIEFALA